MGPLIITNFVVGGMCLAVALLHLVIFIRRPELKANFFFALMCLCVAVNVFSENWVYRAVDLSTFLPAYKIQIAFQGIQWIFLTWFIAFYTGATRRWLAMTVTGAYALAVFVHIISPHGILYSNINEVYQVTLAWGESITYASGSANKWRFVADAGWILLIYLAVESCVRLGRRGNRRRALLLGASLFVFLGLAYLQGTLIDLGVVGPPAVYNISFLGLVLVMGASMTGEVVRASVLSREVESNERRWRSLLENVKLLVAGLDSEGRLNYVNPYLIEISGYQAEELIGKPFVELGPEQERNDRLQRFQNAMEGSLNPYHQSTILPKNGSPRHIFWSNVILRDSHEKINGTLSVGADITSQLEAESARDRAIQELEAFKNRLEDENIYLKEELQSRNDFTEIVGESNGLLYVLSKVQQVAETNATVLVQGETGVGKELISRAIHEASPRAKMPFVKVNCAALPANLVESELFGHVSGAFTGADQLRKGRFELADGGTILLDEISELSLETQAKLLRVLQESQFERVGGSETLTVDVRFIAITNRILKDEIAAGRFRADLFYRLNVYPITVPPLRNRKDDIPLLIQYFVPRIASR
ncbi:MAG: sigma 54-interacting transcriptional regulator, partial [Proteobacteria bacterium]|nr:sigma 54-interacting transcriptional regulator [Pseudomonadota bacterium]